MAALLSLVAAEAVLRVAGRPVEWDFGRGADDPEWEARAHRDSELPGLVYEMRPGIDLDAVGIHIRTNSMGFRSPEISFAKPAGTIRIIALGDSVTFGFGVAADETYPARLQALLSQAKPGQVEVVNMGVSAYNTGEELALFRGRGAGLYPDLVIIQYYLNDPDLEPFDPVHSYYLAPRWWTRLHLTRLIKKTWWRFLIWLDGDNDFYIYLHRDPESWGMVTVAFSELSAWSKERGVPMVLVIFPVLLGKDWPEYKYKSLHEQVAEAGRSAGFFVLDLLPVFAGYPRERLVSKVDDFHPSGFAHDLCARELSGPVEEFLPARIRRSRAGRGSRSGIPRGGTRRSAIPARSAPASDPRR